MEGEKGKELPKELSDAVAQVYQHYHDYLVRYAQQKGLSKYAAEDVVQEVFLIVCENPEKLFSSWKQSSWLLGILNHRIKHLKRDLRYAEQLQTELELRYSEEYEDQLALRLIYSGIIREKDLEMLILYGVEGVSYKELGARFGMGEPACRKSIERIRKRFIKALGEDQNDE